MNHNSAKMVPVSRAFTTSSLAEYREGVGTLRANGGDLGGGSETLIAKTLTAGAGQRYDFESDTFAIQATVIGRDEHSGPNGLGADATGAMFTLTKTDVHAVVQPVLYQDSQYGVGAYPNAGSLRAGRIPEHQMVANDAMQVRRLTPVECERLQGFPDGYTNIPWRKATESPDGPRYKALGNSMAVPVMAWIGNRIKQVSEL
jgi:DNA (cytosine-5)-methyltransferase 1